MNIFTNAKLLVSLLVILLLIGAFSLVFHGVIQPVSSTPTPPPAGLITIEGVMVCLPHKNTSGPQTLECAFGLKDDVGMYFALSDTDPTYKNISGVPMNTRVTVDGTFAPRTDSKYRDVGIISVTKVTQVTSEKTLGGGGATGIRGTALLGPTCPVLRDPPDPQCADRPYKTSLVVTSIDGTRQIKRFSTDSQGSFSVELPAGDYAIRSVAEANILPHCASNGPFTVRVGVVTEVAVSCDTGIR